jgi:adenylate cyclase
MNDPLTRWLLEEGCTHKSMGDLVEAFCAALRKAGVPVDRIFLGTVIPHPQAAGVAVVYDALKGERRDIEIDHQRFTFMQAQTSTPFRYLLTRAIELRAKLCEGEVRGMDDLRELKADGYTDFIGFPLTFMGQTAGGVTFCSQRPEGFTEAQISALQSAIPALSAVAYLVIQRLVQRTLLCAYLGKDAGNRVHRGQVHRGQGTTVRAAILFADMRGFTKLSSEQPREAVLEILNAVFEVTVGAIQEQGGQVLKFMGDGLLATFSSPLDEMACSAAEAAAIAAQTALSKLAEARGIESKITPGLGVGLHLGEVVYGNIGAPGRLDFTVIGAAVNLAARIESVCGQLGEKILMSPDFVDALNQPRRSCGEFDLKGVPHPVTIFAPENCG